MIKDHNKSRPELPAGQRCVQGEISSSNFFRFIPHDGRELDFSMTHLLGMTLESNSDFKLGGDAPPERLILSFSGHDVVIVGWRLRAVRKLLASGDRIVVRARDARYATVSGDEPFVSEIRVVEIDSHERR